MMIVKPDRTNLDNFKSLDAKSDARSMWSRVLLYILCRGGGLVRLLRLCSRFCAGFCPATIKVALLA